MNNNTFSIDYTERKLVIEFNGESHSFNLNQGDTGDFWHGFEDMEGRIWDVNFYQEDMDSNPQVSVYPCVWIGDENGGWEVDTGELYPLDLKEKVGDPKDYFPQL